jgi:hypothetical protein
MSVRLYYCLHGYQTVPLLLQAQPGDYYRITGFPIREMSGSHPEDWLRDFVTLSQSSMWQDTWNRRAIRPGDVLVQDTSVWLVVQATDPTQLTLLKLPPLVAHGFLWLCDYCEQQPPLFHESPHVDVHKSD